jgi:hypothetical protein
VVGNPKDNYDMSTSLLVAEFNGFMSLFILSTITASKSTSYIYRVSQEECARLREGVPYGKGC